MNSYSEKLNPVLCLGATENCLNDSTKLSLILLVVLARIDRRLAYYNSGNYRP